MEECEARLLYSADNAFAAALALAGNNDQSTVRVVTDDLSPSSTLTAGTTDANATTDTSGNAASVFASDAGSNPINTVHGVNLVFIDARVENADQLAQDVMAHSSANRPTEVVMLDLQHDGLDQIQAALQGRHDIAAIHVLSEGNDAGIYLGNIFVSESALQSHSAAMEAIRESLTPNGDFLLYGCNVANTPEGKDFVAKLASLIDADVAASTNLTGSALRGGDWTLEFSIGQVESSVIVSEQLQQQWFGVMNTYTVTTVVATGAGSLNQAIIDANANPGLDTIAFSVGTGTINIVPSAALTTITSPVNIDATTQGALVVLNGQSAPSGSNGFSFTSGGSGSTITGFDFKKWDNAAIYLNGANNVTITNNFIGPDVSGNTGGTGQAYGVYVLNSANVHIGGTGGSDKNTISYNGTHGIVLTGSSTTGAVIEGNYIGLQANGGSTTTSRNGTAGIYIANGATGNLIGGTTSASRNIISDNVIGILINNASSNTVSGNWIGPSTAGTTAPSVGNSTYGIEIRGGSQSNIIGGTTSGERNVISANGSHGVYIWGASTSYNVIKGNYIGVGSGGAVLANAGAGIYVGSSASDNTIGGTTSGERNVISGNTGAGISLNTTGVTGTTVLGNYIGSSITTNSTIVNGSSDIVIVGDSNTIGGNTAGAANVLISDTVAGRGISIAGSSNVIKGNYIGANVAGTAYSVAGKGIKITSGGNNTIGGTGSGDGNVIANSTGGGVVISAGLTGNAIYRNSMYNNGTAGIDLGNDGVINANDGAVSGASANNGMDYPVLTSSIFYTGSSAMFLAGYVGSAANQSTFASARVEFFKSSRTTGSGDGRTYLGTLTTDASGNFSGNITSGTVLTGTDYVTATATDASGNTSEFSVNRVVTVQANQTSTLR